MARSEGAFDQPEGKCAGEFRGIAPNPRVTRHGVEVDTDGNGTADGKIDAASSGFLLVDDFI